MFEDLAGVEASGPETKAIQDLVRSLFPDQRGPNDADADAAPCDATGIMFTLHSFSDLVLWPWGVTSAKAPNATELELIGRRLAAYNRYTPQQAIQLYPTSGTTDDWSYGELGVVPSTWFSILSQSGSALTRRDQVYSPKHLGLGPGVTLAIVRKVRVFFWSALGLLLFAGLERICARVQS